jgi:hypothetical protein
MEPYNAGMASLAGYDRTARWAVVLAILAVVPPLIAHLFSDSPGHAYPVAGAQVAVRLGQAMLIAGGLLLAWTSRKGLLTRIVHWVLFLIAVWAVLALGDQILALRA